MAAKGAKARAAARKQRDKWKSKRWFTIRAPRQPWQYKIIGETLGETMGKPIGVPIGKPIGKPIGNIQGNP